MIVSVNMVHLWKYIAVFVILVLFIFILGLSGCSTSPVVKSEHHSYKVIEGHFGQFVKDLHWERIKTTSYTHVTTVISGIDTTFVPGSSASTIHARARKKETDGTTEVDIKFSVNDVTYTYDYRTDGNTNPNPHPHYSANIIGEDEKLDVKFLGHFSGQEGIEYGEWEDFSISLNPSFIERLKTLRGLNDKKFIGNPINIEFFRMGFETLRFKILPSEILAAIHGLESGMICDSEYEKRLSRYANLCPAVHP